jgi:zinc/manganese transport system permease protein
LGKQVLRRGIVFIDLALAQVAGLGVVLMDTLGFEPHGWRIQIAAWVAASSGALLLTWTQKRWPEVQEALVGVLFVTTACLGLLLLARNPHGGEHVQELLAGQILWTNWSELVPAAIIYAFVLTIWYGFEQRIGDLGFYLLFAVAVTVSVQLVGIYLVFASLIVPVMAARVLPDRLQIRTAYIIGAVGYGAGLFLSTLFDLPTGPIVVCALVAAAIAFATARKSVT